MAVCIIPESGEIYNENIGLSLAKKLATDDAEDTKGREKLKAWAGSVARGCPSYRTALLGI